MHTPEQKRKVERDMKESMDHHMHANVMHNRGGMEHEDHKMSQMHRETEEAMEHGMKVGRGMPR